MDLGSVNLGDLKGSWKVASKIYEGKKEQELEDLRISFYMGALAIHSIINNASKLPEPYPVQVINSMDAEIDNFKAQMHALAQKAADNEKAKLRLIEAP